VLTAAVVLRQLSVMHESRALAVTDNLTGLANRALLRATLSRALARPDGPAPSACCCSTWTRRRSTERSGTRPATPCWSPWPDACGPAPARLPVRPGFYFTQPLDGARTELLLTQHGLDAPHVLPAAS